jgi:multiple sugar transport system substrate-binding protein
MFSRAAIVALMLALIPATAHAADFVVWWEQGFYPQADEAVVEIVAAFEQETGKEVELVQLPQDEIMLKAAAALEAGAPPDFLFGTVSQGWGARWAHEDQLVELDDVLGPILTLFDPDTVDVSTMLNARTGERAFYALPMGRASNHIHVWNSLLERAGFSLADIPGEWAAFWSFWCDKVQPAVRQALNREDIWAVGLPMGAAATVDTEVEMLQFQLAYQAPWLSEDRRVQVDDARVRAGMVQALDDYADIWRKGCTPPASVHWRNPDNNQAFLAQTVVMTPNFSLSIPAALKRERPDDYERNAATIDWPQATGGEPLVIVGRVYRAVAFKAGRDPVLSRTFVRFLAEEGWLAHWLTFMGDQFMPPMRKLLEQPFWLDSSDPHRMRAAIQIMTEPHLMDMDVRDHEWRSGAIWGENVWGKAVHRVVADGITPEQAVDEAIVRIKEILGE